jgi:putative ABC transport system substrate-binding protein
VEGRNLVIEFRSAGGKLERLPELSAELVRLKVDVLLCGVTDTTRAAREATDTIPIVMVAVADPVGAGFVVNLARPGGNIMGLTGISFELNAKRLQLLKEVVPSLSRVAVLLNPAHPAASRNWQEARAAAPGLSLQLQRVEVRDVGSLEAAFARMGRDGAQALAVLPDALMLAMRTSIATLAMKHRLPVISEYRQFVAAGGLMAYSADLADLYRRAAALGLTIPPAVLARAHEVIQ